jgi:hypothetical protein
LEFAIGGWLSPVAGIFWFWPLTTVILLLATISAIFAIHRRCPWRICAPPLVAVLTLIAFVAGLGMWWAPFGWIAYGPRLAVPLLPAGLVVVLLTAGPTLSGIVRSAVRTRTAVIVVALVVAALGWTQYGAPWTHGAAVQQLIAADDTCPKMTEQIMQDDPMAKLRCTSHVMWRLHSATLDDAALRGGSQALLARVVAAGASTALTAAALVAIGASKRQTQSQLS